MTTSKEDDDVAKAVDAEQPVLIRVVEWTEWLPASLVKIGEKSDPRDPTGATMMTESFPVHRGYTGFVGGANEHLVDIAVQATGRNKMVELDEDGEDGKPLTVLYGHYAFQAILAHNVSAENLAGIMDGQNAPLKLADERQAQDPRRNGRDRRGDLIIPGEPTPGAVPPMRGDQKGKRPRR